MVVSRDLMLCNENICMSKKKKINKEETKKRKKYINTYIFGYTDDICIYYIQTYIHYIFYVPNCKVKINHLKEQRISGEKIKFRDKNRIKTYNNFISNHSNICTFKVFL